MFEKPPLKQEKVNS